jgi:hypothetical protein
MQPRDGKSPRCDFIPKRENPGPAEYTADDRPTSPRAPVYSITGDNPGDSWIGHSFTKGPAAYAPNYEAGLRRAPRFTIRPNAGRSCLDPVDPSIDAEYVNLVNPPYAGPALNIRPKEYLDLMPE